MQQMRHDVDHMHLRCMLSRLQKILWRVSDAGVPMFIAGYKDINFKHGREDAVTRRPGYFTF